MANFFLIDQSLRDASGHHYDYVQSIARAANEMGFLTTIGTHRRFPRRLDSDVEVLNSLGPVRRLFRNTTYHHDSYLAGLQRMKRGSRNCDPNSIEQGWFKNLRHRIGFFRHWRRREKLIRQFATDCEIFFRHTMFTPNDHAFFTTVSELELMGLALFLSRQPRAMQAQWHLQFHFNVFNGRPPDYGQQSSTAAAVRSCFLAAVSRMSFHAVNFYATSIPLAGQYNQLGVGDFEPLPYPVGDEFAFSSSKNPKALAATRLDVVYRGSPSMMTNSAQNMPSERLGTRRDLSEIETPMIAESQPYRDSDSFHEQPLRLTCPGGIRREKGQSDCLQSLVDEIYQPWLSTGHVQLVLQRQPRTSLRREKINLTTPANIACEAGHDPIVYANHPLPRDQYIELIRSTDIGLLLYDSDVYYSRRAGVLGELLSAGKPVIVPAGCWLAEQIQEPIFRHADRQFADRETRRCELADLRWESNNVPMSGGVLSFDAGRRPFNFEFDVRAGESIVGLRFHWHWPIETGIYCRIELTQLNSAGKIVERNCQIVGHRDGKKPIAMFSLAAETKHLNFSLRNAFHHSNASINHIEIVTSCAEYANVESQRAPIGAVGVVAADRAQVGRCLQEILEHFDHYRTTAEAFSGPWHDRHRPQRSMAHLISSEFSEARVA